MVKKSNDNQEGDSGLFWTALLVLYVLFINFGDNEYDLYDLIYQRLAGHSHDVG